MDIEGGEPAALRGMTGMLAANPLIRLITEFNPECFIEAKLEPRAFLRQLEEIGFHIYVIRPLGDLDKIISAQPEAEIMRGEKFVNVYCVKYALKL